MKVKAKAIQGDFGIIIGYNYYNNTEYYEILDWDFPEDPATDLIEDLTKEELSLLKDYIKNWKSYKRAKQYAKLFLSTAKSNLL